MHSLNTFELWQTSLNAKAQIAQSSKIAIGIQQKKMSFIKLTLLKFQLKIMSAICTGT